MGCVLRHGMNTQQKQMRTRKVSILVFKEAVPASIVDPSYMLSAVNQFLRESGREPAFEVQLVGRNREVPLNHGVFSVRTDAALEEVKKTDLVIIPALSGDLRSEEHTSELQSRENLVCRLLLEKKKNQALNDM